MRNEKLESPARRLIAAGLLGLTAALVGGCAVTRTRPVTAPVERPFRPTPEQIADIEARQRVIEEAHKYFPDPEIFTGTFWRNLDIRTRLMDEQMVVLEIRPEQNIENWRHLLTAYITSVAPADLTPDIKHYLSNCRVTPLIGEENNYQDYIQKWVDKVIFIPQVFWRGTIVPIMGFTGNYYSRNLYAGMRPVYANALYDFQREIPLVPLYELLLSIVHEAAHKEDQYLFEHSLLPPHMSATNNRHIYAERHAQLRDLEVVFGLRNIPDFPEKERMQRFIDSRFRSIARINRDLGLAEDNLFFIPEQ